MKHNDYDKHINRSFLIAFVIVILLVIIMSAGENSQRNVEVTEDEYYNSENYANTGESYEQYKTDKEFIHELYEATQNR